MGYITNQNTVYKINSCDDQSLCNLQSGAVE